MCAKDLCVSVLVCGLACVFVCVFVCVCMCVCVRVRICVFAEFTAASIPVVVAPDDVSCV